MGENAERRLFLLKGVSLLGGLFGCRVFSKAHACEKLRFPILRPSPPVLDPPAPPRVAIIIDDFGNSICRAREFLDLGMPISFSILPQLRQSSFIAEELYGRGEEIMLHQPMEPYRGDLDPGPGALYVSDRPVKIEETIERNLEDFPPLSGVNNHMGSRFTSSPEKVDQALRVIKEKDLFFIDSVTSSRSTAYATARRLHMRTAFRNLFLDTSQEEGMILRRLEQLEVHAFTHGAAIGIGHPYEATLRALERYSLKKRRGGEIAFVRTSDLLRRPPFPHPAV